MKNLSTLLLLLAFFLSGCTTKPKEFSLAFTMESLEVYKISIEINKDKSYNIKQQNHFFDAYAMKDQSSNFEGKMTDEEYNELNALITNCKLFKMKNNYGFSNNDETNNNPLDNYLYHINYKQGRKEKYILINPNPLDPYPENLSGLIKFLTNFISNHSKT